MSGKHGARRRGGAPIVVGSLALVLLAPLSAVASGASWVDVERDSGAVSTLDCAADGTVARADSHLLGGTLLGSDLSAVAALGGATAEGTGTGPAVVASDPLSVSALSTINADLGGSLMFDLAADAGALHQYAQASADGVSLAATGAVTDEGAIALTDPSGAGAAPRFATFALGDVLDALVDGSGTGISQLSDVAVTIGALASVAELDGCAADWDDSVAAALDRAYAIAGLGAALESPLVTAADSALVGGLPNVESSVEAVAGDSGLTAAIGAATVSALSSTLSGFLVGTPAVSLALDVDLSGIIDAVGREIADPGGIAAIDLETGTVTVDLERLLGPAYEHSVGLNGLAPNTQLLLNADAIAALSSALADAATAWLADLSTAVGAAVDVLTVDLQVTVPISVVVAPVPIVLPSGTTVPVGSVVVSASDVSLASLEAGTAPISVTTALTPPSCSGLVGSTICAVVNPLLTGLTTAVGSLVLNGILGPVVGGLIADVLDPVPGLEALVATVSSALDSVVAFVAPTLTDLFGEGAVLSLVVNAQNAPNPAEVSSPPGSEPGWLGLAAPTTDPYRTGAYSVAALRLVTLGVVSGGVAVDLARSTVGPNGG